MSDKKRLIVTNHAAKRLMERFPDPYQFHKIVVSYCPYTILRKLHKHAYYDTSLIGNAALMSYVYKKYGTDMLTIFKTFENLTMVIGERENQEILLTVVKRDKFNIDPY